MSITAYTGLPGSGKSYGVVEQVIIPALEGGRTVVTNIPLNEMEIYKYLHDQGQKKLDIRALDMDRAKNTPNYLSSFPGGAVIVMDELWRLWPAGLKANNVPEDQKSFLAEHRHRVGADGRSQEIIFVTQDLAQIAAFARQLVEETYRATKLTAVGQKDKFRIDVFMGAAVGQNPANRLREIFSTYKESVFRFYSSHTMSETGQAGKEEKLDNRANALRAGIIRYGIPAGAAAVLFGAWFAFTSLTAIFNKEPEKIGGGASTAQVIPDKYQPKLTPPGAPGREVQNQMFEGQQENERTGTPYSTTWRLGGYINGFKDGQAKQMAVLIGRGRMRYIPTESCRPVQDTPEIECQVDGETVTFWSGQNMNNVGVTQIERQS
ncbi:MAG: zonular occludens toxin domain-containing protein [Sedimenticola sp.]